jgi:hypothetical protein
LAYAADLGVPLDGPDANSEIGDVVAGLQEAALAALGRGDTALVFA